MRTATKTALLLATALFLTTLAPFTQGGEPAASPALEPKALTFPISYTGEVLANPIGGARQGVITEGLLNLGVQGDLEKLLGWQGGSFLVSDIYPHGSSLSADYVHDFNAVSSIDAYDTPRLYEAWLQQELCDKTLNLRLGQLLADTEFFLSDNAALFLNSAFGAIPLVSQNFRAPVYPIAAPGARLRWTPSEAFSVQAGIYDGGTGTEPAENPQGRDWNLSGHGGALALTEAAYKSPNGTYKAGIFYHTPESNDDLPHPACRPDAGGYLIADQQLWHPIDAKDQGLSGFARIGAAPDDRNTVPFYFDTGFNYKGLLPGREKDIAGLGLSYTKLSKNLRDETGEPVETHHETILEATYKIQIKDWLTLQPDCQYLFNPSASQKTANALIVGLRLNLTFP